MKFSLLLFVAFVNGFALMVFELVASRLVAPYLGVSIYTWTSVIGIVLAGIAAGNFVGGFMADKTKNPIKILSSVLAIASILILSSLFLVHWLGNFLSYGGIYLPIATLILTLVSFMPGSFFFGFITPLLIKLSINSTLEAGRVSGKIYGVGTLGSILGTFATGFFLIPSFGTKGITIGVAVALMSLAILIAFKKKLFSSALLGIILLSFLSPQPPCLHESQYYCIALDPGHDDQSKALRLDYLYHSYIYPDAPQNLGDGIQDIFALLNYYSQVKFSQDPKVLFIGGGGYVVPRFLSIYMPGAQIEVVEIDPQVTKTVTDFVGNLNFSIYHTDALVYLNRLAPDKKYDLIIGDAFNDFEVPYQLTTREFVQKIDKHLTNNGIYAVNVVDNTKRGQFLYSMLKTINGSMPNMTLITPQEFWQTSNRTTSAIIGSKTAFDLDLWESLKDKINQENRQGLWVAPASDVSKYTKLRGKILTDNYAPVEQMLSKVFIQSQSHQY